MFINYIKSKAIQNKYLKYYSNIIENAINRTDYIENFEMHHIVPRSFKKEWSKEKDNIVKLTYREHFIVHRLLCKMFTDVYHRKMIYALGLIMGKHKINSRVFEILKISYSKYNIMKSEEQKLKVSLSLTGRTKDTHEYIKKAAEKKSKTMLDPNGKYQTEGKIKIKQWRDNLSDEERKIIFSNVMSEEQKRKLSNDRKGQTAENSERVKKMKNTMKEKYKNMSSEERKKALGRSKGMKWYHNDELKQSKTFNPNNVPVGWKLGRIYYEKNKKN